MSQQLPIKSEHFTTIA